MYPINLNYVTPQTIHISDNGESKQLTVLVLDEAAHTDYWKRITCFAELLKELKIQDAKEVVSWHVSTAWGDKTDLDDLARYTFTPGPIAEAPLSRIYDIPVSWIEDEREFVVLELPEKHLVENKYWK